MARRNSRKPTRAASEGRVKIIAGECGGRYIHFQEADGLRPTGGRIRETLFSWLQSEIAGATVLDMYAGSGVLGFEAASRGALHVDMLEQFPPTVKQLKGQLDALAVPSVDVHQCSALDYLQNTTVRYDVVFVDPPFHGLLMQQSLVALKSRQVLLAGSLLYLEFERKSSPELPDGWEFKRVKEAGDVGYGLVRIPD